MNQTFIHVILDKSGSMESCRADTIGGFNSFVKKQKEIKADSAFLSLYQFDHEYFINYQNKKIEQVEELTYETFEPNGQTALLDAIGKTITPIQHPGESYVIIVIITDGQENSSQEFSKSTINDLIQKKKELGWEFVFLGANQDAIQEASTLGICGNSALTYDTNNSKEAFTCLSGAISRSRSTPMKEARSIAFTPQERSLSLGSDVVIVSEKRSWPELIGYSGEEAKRIIEMENPNLNVQIMNVDIRSSRDLRNNRVRIVVDRDTNRVVSEPKVG